MSFRTKRSFHLLAFLLMVTLSTGTAFASPGQVFTTDKAGTVGNENINNLSRTCTSAAVSTHASGLPDGTYYLQVTGGTLLFRSDLFARPASLNDMVPAITR